MMKFDTITPVTAGIPGTSPTLYCAATSYTLAQVTTVGFLRDDTSLQNYKPRDYMFITYGDGTANVGTGIFVVANDAISLNKYAPIP